MVYRSAYVYDDDGEDDLEKGKRRRFKAWSWRTMLLRLIGRSGKTDARSLFVLTIGLGTLFLLVVYLRFGRISAPFSVSSDGIGGAYPYGQLRNLVMVAGHSVYTSRKCAKADDEGSWFLESYQKHPGQAASFLEHIHRGVAAAARDNESMLLFSGGETRKSAGPRSEAQSYWSVAESNDWFGHSSNVRDRALTEEHARDSFENLLFSICRFRELTGIYPRNITVVSYNFKGQRFVGLHRAALKFPVNRFFYQGTLAATSSAAAAIQGELRVQNEFRKDPYGCSGSLREKRDFRALLILWSGCDQQQDALGVTCPGVYNWKRPFNQRTQLLVFISNFELTVGRTFKAWFMRNFHISASTRRTEGSLLLDAVIQREDGQTDVVVSVVMQAKERQCQG